MSYKMINTMCVRATAPSGKDPSMTIALQMDDGSDQELKLVLYKVPPKYRVYLEDTMIGSTRVNHLIAAWRKDGEIEAAFWCGIPSDDNDTAKDDNDVYHDVMCDAYRTMMKGRGLSKSLIEVDTDTKPPTTMFDVIPGEYGAAVREATMQEYERNKEACFTTAFRSIEYGSWLDTIAKGGLKLLKDAGVGIAKGIVDAGTKSHSYGYSPVGDEAYFEVISQDGGLLEVMIMETEPSRQPYRRVIGVYNQYPTPICVLCSIAACISINTQIDIEKAYQVVNDVFPIENVPRYGLNPHDAFGKLQEQKVLENCGLSYKAISPTVGNLKKALDNGFPIAVGTIFDNRLDVYEQDLHTPITGPQGGAIRHCITVVGYDDADSTFTFLNSWGPDWGRDGALVVCQDYGGFDVAIVVFPSTAGLVAETLFAAVDIPDNLPTINPNQVNWNLKEDSLAK